MAYCIYLRKSRADIEAEARGEGETLAKHEATLLELARKQNLQIGAIYKEIVSGETIAARPEMQKLLQEVSDGKWDGVLVMEIERLARGNTMDQGLVSNAFTFSGTKIITPLKTYDPTNEYDNEYFEFSLFMSRREYKTIRRRMEAGRIAAVKEGCYIGGRDPYGYKRYRRSDGKYSLTVESEQAEIVKLVYQKYANDEGLQKIANYLNEVGIKSQTECQWTADMIRDMIKNPLYKGYVRWNSRKSEKHIDGTVSRPRSKESEIIIAKGLHEPIISEELWDKVNATSNPPKNRIDTKKELINPFAGIIKCGYCNHAMVIRTFNSHTPLFCYCRTSGCQCVGSHGKVVEEIVIKSLKTAYEDYNMRAEQNQTDSVTVTDNSEQIVRSELDKITLQLSKQYDLLERGIYTPEIFLERQKVLTDKKTELESKLCELTEKNKKSTPPKECAEKIKYVIDNIANCKTAEDKNKLYKTIIKKITYYKTTNTRWSTNSDLHLDIDYKF